MTGRFLRTSGGTAVRYRNPDGRRLGVPCDLHGEEAALTAGRVLDRIGRQLDGHHDCVVTGRGVRQEPGQPLAKRPQLSLVPRKVRRQRRSSVGMAKAPAGFDPGLTPGGVLSPTTDYLAEARTAIQEEQRRQSQTNPSTKQVLYSGLTRFFPRLYVKGEWTS